MILGKKLIHKTNEYWHRQMIGVVRKDIHWMWHNTETEINKRQQMQWEKRNTRGSGCKWRKEIKRSEKLKKMEQESQWDPRSAFSVDIYRWKSKLYLNGGNTHQRQVFRGGLLEFVCQRLVKTRHIFEADFKEKLTEVVLTLQWIPENGRLN